MGGYGDGGEGVEVGVVRKKSAVPKNELPGFYVL
jgi:hypothetical protein